MSPYPSCFSSELAFNHFFYCTSQCWHPLGKVNTSFPPTAVWSWGSSCTVAPPQHILKLLPSPLQEFVKPWSKSTGQAAFVISSKLQWVLYLVTKRLWSPSAMTDNPRSIEHCHLSSGEHVGKQPWHKVIPWVPPNTQMHKIQFFSSIIIAIN